MIGAEKKRKGTAFKAGISGSNKSIDSLIEFSEKKSADETALAQ